MKALKIGENWANLLIQQRCKTNDHALCVVNSISSTRIALILIITALNADFIFATALHASTVQKFGNLSRETLAKDVSENRTLKRVGDQEDSHQSSDKNTSLNVQDSSFNAKELTLNNASIIQLNDPAPPKQAQTNLNSNAINSIQEGIILSHETKVSDADEDTDAILVDASPGFVSAAELFQKSIDEKVDPCDDFFQFACGKWIENNKIPDDLTSYGHFPELREKVNNEMKVLFEEPELSSSKAINTMKHIYRACMDVENLNHVKSGELLKQVEEFGYWPIVHGNSWDESKFDLNALLINVGRSRAIDVFHDIYVSLDQKNVSRRLLHFDQGSLSLGGSSREYYLNDTRYGKQLDAYTKYQIEKIKLIVKDAGTNTSIEEIENAVAEMLEFEKAFARILVPEDKRRNYTKMYNVHRLSDMYSIIPEINWNDYFEWMVPDELVHYLDSDPEVIVIEPDFFRDLTKLLQSTEKRILANYIYWRYTSAWSFQLDERFDDIQQDFLKVFIGKNKKSPRWKDCLSSATSKMSYASGAMYVRKYFDKKSKDVAMDMIEDLRAAFRQMLQETEWMDLKTKKYALEKADDIVPLIGFPQFLFNDTLLDEYYLNFTLSPGDGHAKMVEKSSWWAQRKAFRRLAEDVDRFEFGTSSAVVNAFYSGVKNAITFPAAILQAPFFDRSFPKFVNYGAIGAVIGHEITHGFDDQGSQFDKIGNLKNWWATMTSDRFLSRKKCIIDQYSSFDVRETNSTMRINGILTQGENIADNGGIKEAFIAYRSHIKAVRGGEEEKRLPGLERYTPNQMFFMAFAQVWCGKIRPEAAIRQLLTDPHSPNRYRVNGVLINQEQFAKEFSCPEGSPMNPGVDKRCSVW